MVPTAARRAKPVQRNHSQGLQGNPDACRPRRGSACDGHKKGTGRGCTPGSCLLCTACRRHESQYWGAQGGRSPPALLSPHFFGKKWGPRPGRPAHPGVPRRIAGDHRSPPHRRPKLRIIRFRVNAKAHSLRWASSPHDDHSVGSPRGAPLGAPSRTPGHLLLPRWGNSPCRAPRSQQLQGKTGG